MEMDSRAHRTHVDTHMHMCVCMHTHTQTHTQCCGESFHTLSLLLIKASKGIPLKMAFLLFLLITRKADNAILILVHQLIKLKYACQMENVIHKMNDNLSP